MLNAVKDHEMCYEDEDQMPKFSEVITFNARYNANDRK